MCRSTRVDGRRVSGRGGRGYYDGGGEGEGGGGGGSASSSVGRLPFLLLLLSLLGPLALTAALPFLLTIGGLTTSLLLLLLELRVSPLPLNSGDLIGLRGRRLASGDVLLPSSGHSLFQLREGGNGGGGSGGSR